jgi:hypothetical protein
MLTLYPKTCTSNFLGHSLCVAVCALHNEVRCHYTTSKVYKQLFNTPCPSDTAMC